MTTAIKVDDVNAYLSGVIKLGNDLELEPAQVVAILMALVEYRLIDQSDVTKETVWRNSRQVLMAMRDAQPLQREGMN